MLSAWLPVVAYTTLILVFSSMPNLAPPAAGLSTDKLAHALEFGMMGGLLLRAWARSGMPAGRSRTALAVGAGALVALADEFWQGNFGRTTSAADWGADVVGVVVGAVVAARLGARIGRPGAMRERSIET